VQSKMAAWAFVLAVPDINKSAQYFRDVLGFLSVGRMERTGDWPRETALG
jgi:catechol 2,3-dioxygenase-like lactoylglutathione lyase family enzyme